jgi:hypothetical protein
MRQWAGPFGFIGSAASLAFWLLVPFIVGGNFGGHAGGEGFYVALAVLSAIGVVGALMARASSRLAPALMAVAILPAIGALLIPGVLLIVATLLALQEPEPSGPAVPPAT